MVKVKGPLFSLAASGIFNGLMEFRTGGGKTVVHGIRSAPATRSAAQQAQSLRFATAVAGWKNLTVEDRQSWKDSAQNTGHNGYQLYLSEFATQNITPPDQPLIP